MPFSSSSQHPSELRCAPTRTCADDPTADDETKRRWCQRRYASRLARHGPTRCSESKSELVVEVSWPTRPEVGDRQRIVEQTAGLGDRHAGAARAPTTRADCSGA